MNYFNKKYLSLKNFKNLKNDHRIIFNYFEKKKIKLDNKKIIDIGCGNASFIYFLKKKFSNNKFFGLDKDKKLIDFNKKNKIMMIIPFYFFVYPFLKSYLNSVVNGLQYYISTGIKIKNNQFGKHAWFS